MTKYRNKFRISHISLMLKNSIMTFIKGDVPTYVAVDVMNRLSKGEQEIILPMCGDGVNKSLVDYLNEYHHHKSNKTWTLQFMHHAFMFASERIKQKLDKFSDIEVEIYDLSDTDKRVVIKFK